MGRLLTHVYALYLKTHVMLSAHHVRPKRQLKCLLCFCPAGMGRSLTNAYALYLKTRPAASSESVRRSKQLQPEGCHPLLLAAVKHKSGGQVDMQVGQQRVHQLQQVF